MPNGSVSYIFAVDLGLKVIVMKQYVDRDQYTVDGNVILITYVVKM